MYVVVLNPSRSVYNFAICTRRFGIEGEPPPPPPPSPPPPRSSEKTYILCISRLSCRLLLLLLLVLPGCLLHIFKVFYCGCWWRCCCRYPVWRFPPQILGYLATSCSWRQSWSVCGCHTAYIQPRTIARAPRRTPRPIGSRALGPGNTFCISYAWSRAPCNRLGVNWMPHKGHVSIHSWSTYILKTDFWPTVRHKFP